MPFVEVIARGEAQGPVAEMYREIEQRIGHLPNWAGPFSLRPDVWRGWDALHTSIRTKLPLRTYELATLAAARALRSSYCALAHGRVLSEKVLDAPGVTAIMRNSPEAPLEPGERAMMAFVEKIVLGADRITAEDVAALRQHGYADEMIFDIAATGAVRCFFSKLLDAMGVQPDAAYRDLLGPELREALTVGRPVAG